MCKDFEFEKDLKDDFEDEEFFLDVPTECPNCGNALEVDTDYDKTKLICPNCDYELDATEEFKRAAEAYGMDEYESPEED